MKIAVGGTAPGLARQVGKKGKRKRSSDEFEIVFFHTGEPVIAQSIIDDHEVKNIIDLSPADGFWAIAAVRIDVLYLGVCINKYHRQELKRFVAAQVLLGMVDESD